MADSAKSSRETLEEQNKLAAEKKLNRKDLDAIQSEVTKLPAKSREQVKQKLKAGKITKAEQDKREGRKMTARAIPKSQIPPDLHDVLLRWVRFMKGWRRELVEVAKYREYIDTDPDNADIFRKEVQSLINDLKKLL